VKCGFDSREKNGKRKDLPPQLHARKRTGSERRDRILCVLTASFGLCPFKFQTHLSIQEESESLGTAQWPWQCNCSAFLGYRRGSGTGLQL